jgi:hypothetical protein
MSICLCNFRVLSRFRSTVTQSLTPFLYQTATIQRSTPPPLFPCRNASSRPKHEHDIPFEDEIRSRGVDDTEFTRDTTITGSEREAFGTLYKTFKSTTASREGPEREIDQIIDEYYENEDESDPSAASLDTLFNAVLYGRPQHTSNSSRKIGKTKKVENFTSLAEEILQSQMDVEKNAKAAKATEIRKLQVAERERVKILMKAADTDRALWEVLEKEVFGVIREMDLDARSKGNQKGTTALGQKKDGKQQQVEHQTISTDQVAAEPPRFPTSLTSTPLKPAKRKISPRNLNDTRMVFVNYPLHLVAAARILRSNFPSSPLPLAIIPMIKSLGRSSYALGATTSLYRIMIRTAWLQNYSYSQICSLLQDMDNGGVEADGRILELLDEVLHENTMGRRGRWGRGLQTVWSMQFFDEGIKQLQAWRDVIAKRLGVWGERRVGRGEIVRRVGQGAVGDDSKMGPKDELVFRDQGKDS